MIIDTAMPDRERFEAQVAVDVDARPLYIAPGGETRVDLDGPALCITRDERAEQFFPIQRISRIYSGEQAQWSSEALLACAAQGVAVLFVDDDGAIIARLLGRPGIYDSMYHRLSEFLLLPEAIGRYRHWLGGMDHRAAVWAGQRLKLPKSKRDPIACQEMINERAGRYAGERTAERSRQWLRSIAFNWMQSHLLLLGFGAGNELTQSGEPALSQDLTRLIIWYLEPARVGWLKRRWLAAQRKREPVHAPTHADLVRLFESRTTRASARGREITSSLHRWLIHET